MSKFTLDIIIDKEDVQIIKEQFGPYLDEVGEITVTVTSDTDIDVPEELSDVLKKLFFNLIMTLQYGRFKGVN